MKPTYRDLAGAALTAVFIISSALAQSPPEVRSEPPNFVRDRMPHAAGADKLNDAAAANALLGMKVRSGSGKNIGRVEEIAVDLESGRVLQVILSTGGFLGIRDIHKAVPSGTLHRDLSHKVLILDADPERLKSAPPFEMSMWVQSSDVPHLKAVYRHFGEEAAFQFIQPKEPIPSGTPLDEAIPKTGELWDRAHLADAKHGIIPLARFNHIQKVSHLLGMGVQNLQAEKLGKVEDILIDLPSGRLVAVVVSTGGILGIGDEQSAVPPVSFHLDPERDSLQLDATKTSLEQAPHFKASRWPHFSEPSYVDEVYRAYRVEPYFAPPSPTPPKSPSEK